METFLYIVTFSLNTEYGYSLVTIKNDAGDGASTQLQEFIPCPQNNQFCNLQIDDRTIYRKL
jgi:hypothetical protein